MAAAVCVPCVGGGGPHLVGLPCCVEHRVGEGLDGSENEGLRVRAPRLRGTGAMRRRHRDTRRGDDKRLQRDNMEGPGWSRVGLC